jgi:hypothetical protein
MSFRAWRARWIVALSLVWIVGVIAWNVVRSVRWGRQFQTSSESDHYYVFLHLPGGIWLVVGLPLLLLAVWLWQRPRVNAMVAASLGMKSSTSTAGSS